MFVEEEYGRKHKIVFQIVVVFASILQMFANTQGWHTYKLEMTPDNGHGEC